MKSSSRKSGPQFWNRSDRFLTTKRWLPSSNSMMPISSKNRGDPSTTQTIRIRAGPARIGEEGIMEIVAERNRVAAFKA